MNVMEHIIKIYLLFLFFVIGWTKDLKYCMSMITCGYTVPSGDVIVKYGEPVSIICNLYPNSNSSIFPQKHNSSLLYFITNNSRKLIPKYYDNGNDTLNETDERVEILNLTSIRLTIKKPKKMKEFYYCRCNYPEKDLLACSNVVIVGVPPQKIDNFSCKSDNWESMTCSWNLPENFVNTLYKVSLTYPEYSSQEKQYIKNFSTNENHTVMNFTLTANSSPFYRKSQEQFSFLIEMTNKFGRNEQTINWSHFDNIYLKPPEGLNGTATSPSDINLTWNLSAAFPVFPKKLLYEIKYRCENFCGDSWKVASLYKYMPKENERVILYNLTNLEYANVLYDIRVSIKVEQAPNKTWSRSSSTVIRTKSRIPDYPPRTTLGSFQFVNSLPREVYVYFQKVKPQSENGENFSYFVESDPPLKMAEKSTSANAYVKFVGLEERKRYTITIWSQNNVGKSRESSTVIIPSHPAREPFKLWKIVHTSVKYELEWQQRDTDRDIISNYTLFWCEHQYDRPYQCQGFLNWTVVPSTYTRYNVTVEPLNKKTYQFAIAANTIEGSSGMVWATCTILANRTVSKINELIIKDVGSNFIELNWRQDCPDFNSEVIGYVIYYCATNNTSNDSCSTPEKNVTLNGSLSDQSGTVRGLTPYTTYLLAVSVKTKSAIGVRSEYVRNATREAAPSTPPLDITIDDTTNSSITIHWKRPIITNGNIKNYNIRYNNKEKEVAGDLESYTLTNLESYKSYAISMQACTTMCSALSNESFATTKMGTPGQPGPPYQNETSENGMKIFWKRPEQPRGDIQYYQIIITTNRDNVTSGRIINGTNSEFFLYESCQASDKYNNYVTYIRVRAVNIIGNEHYPGLWSDPLINPSCNLQISWYIIYIVIGILVIILLGFGSRKVYDYFKLMKELDIILPAGLAPAVERSEKNQPVIERLCPDEELLLEKMPEKCMTGDSSGCSSGQVSISSSVESTTHLSIDSGTDQPKIVSDDQKENSLRLRNVSSKGYVLHDATPIINRGTKPTSTATGNYCVLGVDTSTKPSQDTPYVTISDIETATTPCISNDKPSSGQAPYTDFFKTPNPGYVPFSNAEPASKNTGYVIAGDLSLPSVEIKTSNVLADTPVVGLKPTTVWQQQPVEPSLAKPGYVSVGDSPPHVAFKEASKGYVPHRQFEAKSLKED